MAKAVAYEFMHESRASQNRAETRASVRTAFNIQLQLQPPSPEQLSAADTFRERMERDYGFAWRHHPDVPQDMINTLEEVDGDNLCVYLNNAGSVTALVEGLKFWVQEEDGIKLDLVESTAPDAIRAGSVSFFGSAKRLRSGMLVQRLGSVKIGCTIKISALQRRFEVLARWQELTRREGDSLPSRIVSCAKRLQLEAGLIDSKVRVRLRPRPAVIHSGRGSWGCQLSMTLTGVQPRSTRPHVRPATAELFDSLIKFITLRLDGKHGLVNRSVHALDLASAKRVLNPSEGFANRISAPKTERQLLRIAVDWATQPNRALADIRELLGTIHFAALPSFTLLHMDSNVHISKALMTFCQIAETRVSQWMKMGIAKQQRTAVGDIAALCVEQGGRQIWGNGLLPHEAGYVWTRFAEKDIPRLNSSTLFDLMTVSAQRQAHLLAGSKN